jgi:hypothetical protein
MSSNYPRLDRSSLARLGAELQAAHHRSEKEPLTDRQTELLLEWAIKEAIEAADQETLWASTSAGEPERRPLQTLQLSVLPQPIATAPRSNNDANSIVLLLFAPYQGGWHTGSWSGKRWRASFDIDVELHPTHWLPPLPDPGSP